MLPKIKEQTIDQGIELGRELSKAAKAAKEDF